MRDAWLVLSDGQALTSVGSVYSTNQIDLGALKNAWGSSINSDPGRGGDLWLNVLVTTAFTSATSTANLKAELVHGASTAPTTVALSGAAKVVASLGAGKYLLQTKLPVGLSRWARLKFTVAGSAMLTGAVTAWIGPHTETEYPH